jgi:hypothetical protein
VGIKHYFAPKINEIKIVTNSTEIDNSSLCPSARSDWEGSKIFGVVGGEVESPKVNYFKQARSPIESIDKLNGRVTPEEVFRIAAPCAEKSCQHFDGQDCRLVMRVVEKLPVVAENLPPCAIRRECRWWLQEGGSACMRCPQVITDNYHPSELMVVVSTPYDINGGVEWPNFRDME